MVSVVKQYVNEWSFSQDLFAETKLCGSEVYGGGDLRPDIQLNDTGDQSRSDQNHHRGLQCRETLDIVITHEPAMAKNSPPRQTEETASTDYYRQIIEQKSSKSVTVQVLNQNAKVTVCCALSIGHKADTSDYDQREVTNKRRVSHLRRRLVLCFRCNR
ncbi:unnamed protein product [Soboliphyme baturini]|uniref:Uncharacterized protein n=1 Tax=Soboliphyme baturini TaxID=241478 RepID=A0A3P8DUA9_9BILA|nr:unnamed protein product [Soboliphyme baturini]